MKYLLPLLLLFFSKSAIAGDSTWRKAETLVDLLTAIRKDSGDITLQAQKFVHVFPSTIQEFCEVFAAYHEVYPNKIGPLSPYVFNFASFIVFDLPVTIDTLLTPKILYLSSSGSWRSGDCAIALRHIVAKRIFNKPDLMLYFMKQMSENSIRNFGEFFLGGLYRPYTITDEVENVLSQDKKISDILKEIETAVAKDSILRTARILVKVRGALRSDSGNRSEVIHEFVQALPSSAEGYYKLFAETGETGVDTASILASGVIDFGMLIKEYFKDENLLETTDTLLVTKILNACSDSTWRRGMCRMLVWDILSDRVFDRADIMLHLMKQMPEEKVINIWRFTFAGIHAPHQIWDVLVETFSEDEKMYNLMVETHKNTIYR